MPSMETSSTSSSVSASSGSATWSWFPVISAVATRSLMAVSLAAQTWTMDAAVPFPSRGDEYIPHVNVTLCHKQGFVPEEEHAVLTSEAAAEPRRGRPPGTSRRELELIAL